ncbi:MAG: hypothetical protein NVSMB25_20430 [Thermoleophilaceae bacterium]
MIVPLQGGPEQALRCFEALATLPDEPLHEVIVVDDASVGLEALLARLEGDVEVIHLGRRCGFAQSINSALERATGEVTVMLRGAPEVAPGWLAPLVDAVLGDELEAAASGTLGVDGAHPVAAHAFALRTERLRAAGGVPRTPDGLEIAALCTTLAAGGARIGTVGASQVVSPRARMGVARRPPGDDPELSVVIPTLDSASERVRACVAAVQRTTDAANEIILVDNGAPPQGFTAPVNSGLRAARGRYAVVMNDDVEVLPGWWAPLRGALDGGAAVAFPLTIDGGMREDFAAWCFGVSRAALERFSVAPGEFFDPELRIWFQDTDLLERLRAAGNPPVCVEASTIRHGLSQTVASHDPELRAWIQEQISRDRVTFLRKHPGAAAVEARLAGTPS